MRRVLAVSVALSSLLGCKSPDPTPTPAPSASSSVGLIGIRVSSRAAPPPGFEPCRDDFAHESDLEAAHAELESLRNEPPKPQLLRAKARARRQPGKLTIVAGTPKTIQVPWSQDIRVTSEELDTFTTLPFGYLGFQAMLIDSLLPTDALVAYISDYDGEHSYGFGARIYVVDEVAQLAAETLDREGRRILRIMACAEQDDASHRAASRAVTTKGEPVRATRLTAARSGGDLRSLPTVDFRVLAIDAKTTMVIACRYEGDKPAKDCNELARASLEAMTAR